MTRGWQAAIVVLLVLFGVFAYESLQLSLRDAIGPGAGFFPFWLSVLGAVLALLLLAQLKLGRAIVGTGELTFDRAGLRNVTLVLAGVIVATALLELVGFRLAMLLLLIYLLAGLGVRNWLAMAIVAGAGSFGVYHVFYDLLKVPLPVGIFGF
ncbi:MAG TPA: tripartite tricarboxylate transporter TctB family protein [Burkholderiales bacterium]|nr:tripartite tricarboxylate transporter TctB family protein [Burkholderiales bacterium]